MTNTETPAGEIGFSETVEFVSDGLFLKSRTTAGETVIIEGNWQVSELNDQSGFLVRYLESNPIIVNCSAGLEEFYFRQDGLLIQNYAIPCDRAEYRYEKEN